MSFLGMFKKKNKGLSTSGISKPAKPQAQIDPGTQDLVETIETPKPVEELNIQNQPTPQNKASFEIPDFSEDDLNIDLPETINEMPEEPPVQEPQPIVQPKPIKEPEPEPKPEELPKFKMRPMLSTESVEKSVAPKTEPIVQKAPPPKIEKISVFVEKQDYISILFREEEVISEINNVKKDLDKLLKFSDDKETGQAILFDLAREIKDDLLDLDHKLFEQGEVE